MKRLLVALCFSTLVCAVCWGQTDATSLDSNREATVYVADAAKPAEGGVAANPVRSESPRLTVSLTPTASSLPPTLTVSTAALLELHGIRKSAVDLCLDLPAKYRTRKPCADIFTHEVRLNNLRKNKQ